MECRLIKVESGRTFVEAVDLDLERLLELINGESRSGVAVIHASDQFSPMPTIVIRMDQESVGDVSLDPRNVLPND